MARHPAKPARRPARRPAAPSRTAGSGRPPATAPAPEAPRVSGAAVGAFLAVLAVLGSAVFFPIGLAAGVAAVAVAGWGLAHGAGARGVRLATCAVGAATAVLSVLGMLFPPG
ncbi:hypothetical protein [Kineococcus glutinatus]|uniref:Uncharacterized protein n=1 Tax=Kineococcus glutinatus TaxID=1070872 RepID=A0ABP9I126_9ACTN